MSKRRPLRGLWILALVLSALTLRAAGCQKKPVQPATPAARAAKAWPTPLLTPPPPAPTPTLRKGVTRVPQLPE